jgi:hypothetical protein
MFVLCEKKIGFFGAKYYFYFIFCPLYVQAVDCIRIKLKIVYSVQIMKFLQSVSYI